MSSVSPQLRSAKRDADRWFREQGLPTFVPLRRWFTDLPRRVAPLVAWVALVGFVLDVFAEVLDALISLTGGGDITIALIVLIMLVVAVAVAWTGYVLARMLLRRVPPRIVTVVATLLIVVSSAWMIVDGYQFSPGATVGPVVEALVILALCILVTGMGGGALIAWASRLAVHNAAAIGHMASIALPVILMLVVFAFFSAEVWQMASALSWGSIALLGLVVAGLAVVVVLRVSASEIDDGSQQPTPEQRAAMLADTPAEHHDPASAPRQRLRAPQRLNILLAMTFAQLVQALFFAALLGALLIVIGGIAIPVGVVELWVGPGNATQPLSVTRWAIGGATLPVTVNLLKVATVLSVIAALPFVFSAVSEQRYRERFFDPIMADMRRAILVRDVLSTKS